MAIKQSGVEFDVIFGPAYKVCDGDIDNDNNDNDNNNDDDNDVYLCLYINLYILT
jgi:hypothetical protein